MIPVITLNGTTTRETCPVCLEPGVKVEHGWMADVGTEPPTEYYDRQRHVWHCPECGERDIIVGFECRYCRGRETKEDDK
jgi:uncharacterized protein with PIN domain